MAEQRPSVAIVIVCYNYAQFIATAIDSAIMQTEQPEQIIVVDDGSTDASREIISSYGNKVTPVFQENAGANVARVNGLALVTSDILLFLDADDYLDAKALEKVRDAWRPDVAKVQYDLEIVDEHGSLLNRRQCNFRPGYDETAVAREFAALGTYTWPVTSGNAYATGFAKRFFGQADDDSFIARLRRGEALFVTDGVLNTLAPLFGAVVTLHQSLGYYRHHTQNISRHHAGNRPAPYPDFPKRIRMRRAEFGLLAEVASAESRTIPPGDLLDNELVFVNYRLMAKKLGLPYEDDRRDTVFGLWRRANHVMKATGIDGRGRLANMLWFTALATSPGALAQALVLLRFDRASIATRWKRRLGLARART